MRCLRSSSGSSLVMTCRSSLGNLLLERRRQLFAHVVGGGDVAAEDDRVEAGLQPVVQNQLGIGQFLVVVRGRQAVKLLGKGAQLLALVVGPVVAFDHLGGRRVALEAKLGVVDRIFVSLNSPPPMLPRRHRQSARRPDRTAGC